MTGVCKVVLAGGVESMSRAKYYSEDIRWGAKGRPMTMHDRLARGRVTAGGFRHPVPGGMLETAENLRREYKIGREEQDDLAVESHRRAVRAINDGRFAEEIIPVCVRGKKGQPEQVLLRDEHPRSEATLESLAKLKPVVLPTDPEATVTAGNASGQNDGAAVCVVTDRESADRLGLCSRSHG